MGDGTGIEWTEATWNPIVGCSAVSLGCDHCYAERQSATRLSKVPAYAGLTEDGKWTGEVRWLPDRLDQPLRWKRPRRIFVNSMSDLFHLDALKLPEHEGHPPLAWIVAVMVAAERHTFQVLTKRPQLMAATLRHPMFKLDVNACLLRMGHPVMPGGMSEPETPWPANIWWGTSIENQRYAFRARHLCDAPAAVRFISAEPLLGPVDATPYLDTVSWVIAGGESGPGARPMHPAWARDLRDQCQAAGVPFLFKQWGEHAPTSSLSADFYLCNDGRQEPLTARQFWLYGREPVRMKRCGKHEAGRELDGRTWDEYPERSTNGES